jgi:hypothetical protein
VLHEIAVSPRIREVRKLCGLVEGPMFGASKERPTSECTKTTEPQIWLCRSGRLTHVPPLETVTVHVIISTPRQLVDGA